MNKLNDNNQQKPNKNEGRSNPLETIVSLEFLHNIGFVRSDRDTYSKKIHAKIFLEYDWIDGFATLIRFEEIVKHDIDRVKITIPKKIKIKQDLINLLNAIAG